MRDVNQKGVILNLRVKPNSSCFKLRKFDASRNELSVNVCSPAQKGKANKELLKGLKGIFASEVELLKGEKSDKKTVVVHAGIEQVLAAIKSWEP